MFVWEGKLIVSRSNGSLLQSAVDRGYRPQEGDTTSSSYSLRPVTVGTTSSSEQLVSKFFSSRTFFIAFQASASQDGHYSLQENGFTFRFVFSIGGFFDSPLVNPTS